ncbi:hypothetical protein J6Y50_06710 [bacterium]|nr:hypothetical protein [bacterium]
MAESIITQSEMEGNDLFRKSIQEKYYFEGGVRKFKMERCSDPRLEGHEMASFWGRCFDLTYMKQGPRKRPDSETKKSKKRSPQGPSHGYSNTVRAISHLSLNTELPGNCFEKFEASETRESGDFRVTQTGTFEELVNFYENGYLRGGVQLYFSDLADFETFDDSNYGLRPKVADRLRLRHFKNPDIVKNPCACFLGFDWGQCKYFGEWDRSIWGAFMPWFGAAYERHQQRREPVIIQRTLDSEKWSFRCAGYSERSTLGFPSEKELPYIYVLERGDIRIYLCPPELHTNPKVPDVVLIIGPDNLRDCVRLTQVEKLVLDFLAEFGFKENKDLREIMRSDLQVTTDLCTVDYVRKADKRNRIVCRSGVRTDRTNKGRSPSGDPLFGTCEFGSRRNRSIFERVYDKRAELEQNEYKDRGKKFYYVCASLGDAHIKQNCRNWDTLTRFEFELKKKIFDDFGVKTFEDLEKKLPSIVKYLTNDWFRIIGAEKGYNHSSRVKIDPVWEALSDTLMSFAEFVATENGGGVSVTRRTKQERRYLNPNWPKSVKKAEEFLTRAVGNLALTLGLDDASQVDEKFLNLILWPAVLRRRDKIRDFVARRGAGYLKSEAFLLYDSRDYYQRHWEEVTPAGKK